MNKYATIIGLILIVVCVIFQVANIGGQTTEYLQDGAILAIAIGVIRGE